MFVERCSSSSLGHHVIVVIITITKFYDCVAFAISHSWLHYIDDMVWAEVTETINNVGLDHQKDIVAHVIVNAMLTSDSDSVIWQDEFFLVSLLWPLWIQLYHKTCFLLGASTAMSWSTGYFFCLRSHALIQSWGGRQLLRNYILLQFSKF